MRKFMVVIFCLAVGNSAIALLASIAVHEAKTDVASYTSQAEKVKDCIADPRCDLNKLVNR